MALLSLREPRRGNDPLQPSVSRRPGWGGRHRLGGQLGGRHRLDRRRGRRQGVAASVGGGRQWYRPGSHGWAGGWCGGRRRRRIRLDKGMFRIIRDPDDRRRRRAIRMATASHRRPSPVLTKRRCTTVGPTSLDSRRTSRGTLVGRRRGRGLRQSRPVVYLSAAHIHHLAGAPVRCLLGDRSLRPSRGSGTLGRHGCVNGRPSRRRTARPSRLEARRRRPAPLDQISRLPRRHRRGAPGGPRKPRKRITTRTSISGGGQ